MNIKKLRNFMKLFLDPFDAKKDNEKKLTK